MPISYHCQKHLPDGLIFKYKDETVDILEKILEAIYKIFKLDLKQDESYLKGIEWLTLLKEKYLKYETLAKINR